MIPPGLYWNPDNQWESDQLFVSLSSRLGTPMGSNYDGNVYAAPEGPYPFPGPGRPGDAERQAETHVRRSGGDFRKTRCGCSMPLTSAGLRHLSTPPPESGMSKWRSTIPMWAAKPGSVSTSVAARVQAPMAPANGDAYAYWTWQPNVVDSPFAVPPTMPGAPGDPGGFNLIRR